MIKGQLIDTGRPINLKALYGVSVTLSKNILEGGEVRPNDKLQEGSFELTLRNI